ncbi:hypothetical protein AVEN_28871-1 [Araneus ventricosus]|uniref:Uncharacterized protein n=1 Tax=Araneus ventricosus TaxID=182803 RepID=A0A4Y2AJ78_ARAVE|nr:hypothetical protein AVEN_28871-1 [Araneus ventricosus]
MGAWCTLNLTSWVKRIPASVLRKFEEGMPIQVSSSSDRGSELGGPSQNSSRVASKRDVDITKLNLSVIHPLQLTSCSKAVDLDVETLDEIVLQKVF